MYKRKKKENRGGFRGYWAAKDKKRLHLKLDEDLKHTYEVLFQKGRGFNTYLNNAFEAYIEGLEAGKPYNVVLKSVLRGKQVSSSSRIKFTLLERYEAVGGRNINRSLNKALRDKLSEDVLNVLISG